MSLPVTPRRPLSLPVLHIMLALADGAKHGYAIKHDVVARTDGAIRLGPGTLYEAVQRLEEAASSTRPIPGIPPTVRKRSAATTSSPIAAGAYAVARSVSSASWSIGRADLRARG